MLGRSPPPTFRNVPDCWETNSGSLQSALLSPKVTTCCLDIVIVASICRGECFLLWVSLEKFDSSSRSFLTYIDIRDDWRGIPGTSVVALDERRRSSGCYHRAEIYFRFMVWDQPATTYYVLVMTRTSVNRPRDTKHVWWGEARDGLAKGQSACLGPF